MTLISKTVAYSGVSFVSLLVIFSVIVDDERQPPKGINGMGTDYKGTFGSSVVDR